MHIILTYDTPRWWCDLGWYTLMMTFDNAQSPPLRTLWYLKSLNIYFWECGRQVLRRHVHHGLFLSSLRPTGLCSHVHTHSLSLCRSLSLFLCALQVSSRSLFHTHTCTHMHTHTRVCVCVCVYMGATAAKARPKPKTLNRLSRSASRLLTTNWRASDSKRRVVRAHV